MSRVSRELPEGHSGKRRTAKKSGRSRSSSSSRKSAPQKSSADSDSDDDSTPFGDDDVSLSSQENIPPESLDESIILVHGEKGVGKSSLLSMFPNSYVLMFERARRNLRIMMSPKKGEPPLNWIRFKKYIQLLLDSDYSNIVVDTLDGCYMECYKWVLSEYGVASPDESDNAPAIWGAIEQEFGETIHEIAQSDKSLMFTSHSKPKPLVAKRKGLKRDGVEEPIMQFDRMEPSCRPAAFRIVQEMADYVMYYGYRDGHRAITVRSPLNIYWTSCGVGDRFLDPDGNPIETFKVGSTPQLAYKSLLDAWSNKLYDIDYIAPSKSSRDVSLETGGRRSLGSRSSSRTRTRR